jgi:hypothetical protein
MSIVLALEPAVDSLSTSSSLQAFNSEFKPLRPKRGANGKSRICGSLLHKCLNLNIQPLELSRHAL